MGGAGLDIRSHIAQSPESVLPSLIASAAAGNPPGWCKAAGQERGAMSNEFRNGFLARIRSDWRKVQQDNFDPYRFPAGPKGASRWRWYALRIGGERARSMLRIARTLRGSENLQWLYDALADDVSRDLLVSIMAFRSLGGRHVRLPLSNPEFWEAARTIERDFLRVKGSCQLPGGTQLDDYDLAAAGLPIRMRAHLLNVMNAFVLQQYRLVRDGHVIEVEPGDVVIDAGACWGDTALYFGNLTGDQGRVYCYEFDPANLELFRHNMQLNPDIARRIQLVRNAVWSKPGEVLGFVDDGASSHVTSVRNASGSVTTDTIDALTSREAIAHVDFIKMDIEGAELEALKGAETTIRIHRPKLAISLYHRLEHFWQIPQFIDSLGLGYQFRLEHFTIHAEETMLFAEAPRGR
jgi:FkbM family methyltransferase